MEVAPLPSKPRHCITHKLPLEYTCFEKSCANKDFICAICVKEDHKKCSVDLLIEIEKLDSIFQLDYDANIVTEIQNRYTKLLESEVKNLNESIESLSCLVDSIDSLDFERCSNENFFKLLKKFFTVKTVGNVTSFQSATSSPSHSNQTKSYLSELEKASESILKPFSALKLSFNNPLKLNKFSVHPYIQKSREGVAILLSRKPEFKENNFFSAVYLESFSQKTTLKIKILGINSEDRFFDMGFFLEENQLEFSSMISYGKKNTWSYCGTVSNQVTGKNTGFLEVGTEVLAKVDPGVGSVSFSRDDGKLSLASSGMPKGKPVMFYLTLFYPEARCLISLSE